MPVENIAVPILDLQDAIWAPERVIALYRKTQPRIHLINVQPKYPSYVSRFFSKQYMARIHEEDGLQVLRPVVLELDKAGVPHWDHVLVGLKAERVAEFVKTHYCSDVLMRDEPTTLLSSLRLGSVKSEIRRTLRAMYH